jgi:hypothetical protein
LIPIENYIEQLEKGAQCPTCQKSGFIFARDALIKDIADLLPAFFTGGWCKACGVIWTVVTRQSEGKADE